MCFAIPSIYKVIEAVTLDPNHCSSLLVLLKVSLALEAGLRLKGKDGFGALRDALEQQETPNTK